MTLSAVMISNTTSRLNYSSQIVPGKKGQDNQCLLSAGQHFNSQLWFLAERGRTESSVMNLPVHGVIISMLHMITVTRCIQWSTLFSRHCSSSLSDTCLCLGYDSPIDLTPGASC